MEKEMDKKIKRSFNSQFNVSNYIKTPFSILVTFFYSAFSIYFIFQIPTNNLLIFVFENPLKVFWCLSFLFLTWLMAYYNLKNINLVNNNFAFSIFLTTLFLGYEFFMIFAVFPNVPSDITNFLVFLWFIFGVILINFLSKIIFIFFEFRSQPLIAKKNIFIALQNFIFLSYIPIAIHFLNKFLIRREPFIIQQNSVILPIIYLFISVVFLIYFMVRVFLSSSEKLFDLFTNSLSFQGLFSITLVRLLPLTVWFFSLENVFNFFQSVFDYLYIAFCFITILITLLLGIYFNSRKKAEGLFLLFSTTSIFVNALTLFSLNYFSLVGEYSSMLFYLISINFFILLNIIFKPQVSFIYRVAFNSFIGSTLFYLIFSILINVAVGIEFSTLPFSLKTVIDILWLSSGAFLLVVNIISMAQAFGKISINTSKLYNQDKKQSKKQKFEKELATKKEGTYAKSK